jgi:hypothetical protein
MSDTVLAASAQHSKSPSRHCIHESRPVQAIRPSAEFLPQRLHTGEYVQLPQTRMTATPSYHAIPVKHVCAAVPAEVHHQRVLKFLRPFVYACAAVLKGDQLWVVLVHRLVRVCRKDKHTAMSESGKGDVGGVARLWLTHAVQNDARGNGSNARRIRLHCNTELFISVPCTRRA